MPGQAAILNEASAFGGGSPLQLERHFDGGKINRQATQLDLTHNLYSIFGREIMKLLPPEFDMIS